MPLNDPIGDMLTRMRNAQHSRAGTCTVPCSNINIAICELMKREGYLANVDVEGEDYERKLTVAFHPEKILEVKRMSSPGRRRFIKAADVKRHLQGYGIAILSTSSGLLTDKEARLKKVGGELLCTITA